MYKKLKYLYPRPFVYDSKLTDDQLLEVWRAFSKCYLNSFYGTMVYADTDSIYKKENNMKREFIVVHDSCNQPIIIRKDSIVVVDKMKGRDGVECRVWLTTGDCFMVRETYSEIVKRLFE